MAREMAGRFQIELVRDRDGLRSLVINAFAIPVDPDSVGLLDSQVAPPRRSTLAHQEALIGAYVRPQDHVRFPMRLYNCPDSSTPMAKSPLSLRWQ